MADADFEDFLGQSTTLRHLVHGHPQMQAADEPKYDVFKQFGVSCAELNLVHACIRLGGRLPTDERAISLAQSGALREAADKIGGFDLVNKALQAWAQEQEGEKRRDILRVDHPLK